MPTLLPDLDREHWKYSDVNAALKKLEVAEAAPVWEMTGAYEFIVPDSGYDVHIRIPDNKKVALPIELKFAGREGERLETRVLLEVGQGAEVTFIERQVGAGSYWKNISVRFSVHKNARVEYYRLCEEDPFCVVTEFVTVDMARDARFSSVVVNGCSGFGRSEFTVNMNEAGAEADLAGLALLSGKQHGDTTVCVNHLAPHCRSSQFFKTLLDDRARGVYQGKILVARDAQKTDGYQLSNNLLLSPLAEMDVKPELEIYADDVKCSHGTTTGELDETPMFYLMSRGIDKDAARRLLIEAFAFEVLDKISNERVREVMEGRVKWWLK